MTTYYMVLCECGNESAELMADGQVQIYARKREAEKDAAHMRLLMEGGARCTYRVVTLR